MDARGLETLLAVALVAALAPAIVSVLPGPKVPQVVILIFGGILIGPHVLGLADTGSIQLLSNIGLGFLFLLAGYELDPRLFRDQTGRKAMLGWAVSALLSVAAVALLASFGFVRDFVPIGLEVCKVRVLERVGELTAPKPQKPSDKAVPAGKSGTRAHPQNRRPAPPSHET